MKGEMMNMEGNERGASRRGADCPSSGLEETRGTADAKRNESETKTKRSDHDSECDGCRATVVKSEDVIDKNTRKYEDVREERADTIPKKLDRIDSKAQMKRTR